jgi:hypothetical protein
MSIDFSFHEMCMVRNGLNEDRVASENDEMRKAQDPIKSSENYAKKLVAKKT